MVGRFPGQYMGAMMAGQVGLGVVLVLGLLGVLVPGCWCWGAGAEGNDDDQHGAGGGRGPLLWHLSPPPGYRH